MGKLKRKTKQLIDSKYMLWSVGFASFLESTVVPIPLEAVLIPLMQAKRERIWWIASMATLGCMLGAALGYVIGYYLFDMLEDTLVSWFSNPEQMESVRQHLNSKGFWYVLSLGIVPIPFQIAMLAAGAVSYSFPLFMLATAIARSIRYFGLALLVQLAGNQAEDLFQRYKIQTVLVLSLAVVLLWWFSTH